MRPQVRATAGPLQRHERIVVELARLLADGDFVHSRQVNFETIHAHEVVAERYGTIGELRAELAGGGHGPRAHTELRAWRRGA